MKVNVDRIKCKTIGNCVKICPEIFRFESGSKKATTKMDKVPEELKVKCIQAANQCPTGAISITE